MPRLALVSDTHLPRLGRRGATLLVNPGSPTDRRRQPAPTFALIDVAAGAEPTARTVALPVAQPKRARHGSTV